MRARAGLQALLAPAPALARAQLVHAGAPGDRQRPHASRGLAAEATHRAHHAQEGLLREIIGRLVVHERGAQTPHLNMGRLDKRFAGATVAEPSGMSQARQLVHGGASNQSVLEARARHRELPRVLERL